MKEYRAMAGGRYTYADDLLNLQELALSFSSIFNDSPGFIISGCEVEGGNISEGFVWLGGKVRHFGGAGNVSFPYYIFESNSIDTVTYANDANKTGRVNYLSAGSAVLPAVPDPVTKELPAFIEIKEKYAPRLADKFIGKYALLLDTPFSGQTLGKDLSIAGNLSVDKGIGSKTALAVYSPAKGYSLKNIIRPDGAGSAGLYQNGLPVSEIVLDTDGSFSLFKGGTRIATFNTGGLATGRAVLKGLNVSAIGISKNAIENTGDRSDSGSIDINALGYNNEGAFYRNFNVYNGKNSKSPVLSVEGKSGTVKVSGNIELSGDGANFSIAHPACPKTDKRLVNSVSWTDSNKEGIACIGYISGENFDFTVQNHIGNLVLSPKNHIDINGELRIKGVSVNETFVSTAAFTGAMDKKVDKAAGKQLSTEDFTGELKAKLSAIRTGSLADAGAGYATVPEVLEALGKKLGKSNNLSDLDDVKSARINLDVFSRAESSGQFLKISRNLLELVSLSAEEINGLTPGEADALKAGRQKAVRDNIDAEKKGTGDLKLSKASNLADLPDKDKARKNISVYSAEETDKKLGNYLPLSAGYRGAVFTNDHKAKLEAIRTGNFAGVDNENKPVPQAEGYVLASHVVRELGKKAGLLLDGYNDSQKKTIASNIGVYQKTESDSRYASVEQLFQDFITFLVRQGKNTAQAQKILRAKLDAPGNPDLNNYLRKDAKLSDLALPDANARKQACNKIGAAYAPEYQTLVKDTGWIQMGNSGFRTDTSNLFARQIGNIVSIQGAIHNNNHDGEWRGGVVAVIPNQIQPPKYSIKNSLCDYNDGHKYNRGASYVILGGDRKLVMYESGWNVATEINFTYMV
jgi:hypothetical protein